MHILCTSGSGNHSLLFFTLFENGYNNNFRLLKNKFTLIFLSILLYIYLISENSYDMINLLFFAFFFCLTKATNHVKPAIRFY
jgi:hypothetical protein